MDKAMLTYTNMENGKNSMITSINDNRGISLIELMIVTAISSVAMIGIYYAFDSQQRSYTIQQQVIEMQQNIRAAMYFMEAEIKMAGHVGFDTATVTRGTAAAGITTAGSTLFQFTMDNDLDGDTTDNGEDITYSLNANKQLIRTDGGNDSVMAYDIEEIGFAYAFDDKTDADKKLETVNAGNIVWAVDTDIDGVLDVRLDTDNDGDIDKGDAAAGANLTNDDDGDSISSVNINRIRSVRVWVLARTRYPVRGYTNSATYKVGMQNLGPYNDGFKRRLLTTTIKCRNMGVL
jgi:type IV pilus assembly protein PilW